MQIVTPTEIESVAWEGNLAAPTVSLGAKSATRIAATIGRPEIWPVADALENEVRQKWTPPLGDADYWLVRLACTLRDPPGNPPPRCPLACRRSWGIFWSNWWRQ
jgi:hypothetical protein